MLVAIATVVQFILGAVWYSFVFGKAWATIMECDDVPLEELKKAQATMGPYYAIQFFITLLSTFVLAMFIYYLQMANVGFHAYGVAGWIWLGFILPTQIGGVIWANTKRKFWFKQIAISGGFQLLVLMVTAFILSM